MLQRLLLAPVHPWFSELSVGLCRHHSRPYTALFPMVPATQSSFPPPLPNSQIFLVQELRCRPLSLPRLSPPFRPASPAPLSLFSHPGVALPFTSSWRWSHSTVGQALGLHIPGSISDSTYDSPVPVRSDPQAQCQRTWSHLSPSLRSLSPSLSHSLISEKRGLW